MADAATSRAPLPPGVGLPGADPRPGQPANLDPNTGLPLASQINPQDYQRANPYLQKMTWAAYGAGNKADPDAERAKYLAALPKYAGATQGRIR